jgi:tripartite-type tricarboxylate transporter receptor subunit TctC
MGKSSENRKNAVETRLTLPKKGWVQRPHPRPVNASKLPRHRFLRLATGAAALSALSQLARAQAYPTRPITMIVPFPAGGPVDTFGRILAEGMRTSLGQPIIIDNISGADGSIGTGRAARAKPDGYTINLGTRDTHVLNGAFYSLPYEVLNDFAPISPLITSPQVLFAKKTMLASDLNELLVWLRANPNKASAGIVGGVGFRLLTALFQKETGAQLTVVPYRGGAPAMQDLVAGQIELAFAASSFLPLVRGGRIKAYAVTSYRRLELAPDIPTFTEAQLPALSYANWLGIFGPKGTPKDVIGKLNAAVVETLAEPTVLPRLAELGYEAFPPQERTPEALGAVVKADAEKWWPIIKELGIK